MTLVTSLLAPAVTGIALVLEPPHASWPASATVEGQPSPAVAYESFAVAARGGDLAQWAVLDDPRADDAATSTTADDMPKVDAVAPSDVLRWMLAFAGLVAIGAVRKPHR